MSRQAAQQVLSRAFPIKQQLDLALSGYVVQGLDRAKSVPAVAQVATSFFSDVQSNSAKASALGTYGYADNYWQTIMGSTTITTATTTTDEEENNSSNKSSDAKAPMTLFAAATAVGVVTLTC